MSKRFIAAVLAAAVMSTPVVDNIAMVSGFAAESSAEDLNGYITDNTSSTAEDSSSAAQPIVDVKPESVNGFKATSTAAASVSLTWGQVDNAQGYIVYRYDTAKKTWVRVLKTADAVNTYKVSGLDNSTSYRFAVKAYKTASDGKELTSPTFPTVTSVTKLTTISGFKASSVTENAIKLTWNKVSAAHGYIVYKYDNAKKTWVRVAKTKTTANTYTVSKLAVGTSYRFAVKAYKTVSGQEIVSESFPTVAAVTKLATVKGFKAASTSESAVKLAWNKVSGAQGYIVYKYDNSKKTWVRVAKTSTAANTYTVGKLAKSTSYRFAVKAYKTVGGKEITSVSFPTLTASTKANIVVKNGVTYVNGVLIVNKTYSIPSTYNPGGLTAETSKAFKQMQAAAKKSGISLWVCSGFRSYSYQKSLYNSYVARDGKAAADRYSARPGHSEHQTGLALDVNRASSSFDNSKEAKWLAAHCAEYGFIIRYPKGKESVTGYKYESWHVRYVGKDLAKKVTASGLTLEEYFGITSHY